MSKQLTKSSRAAAIARQLEALILDGSLRVGDKVPSERQLASRLNASRPLIREAMKELQGRGIIETRHGMGSFVTGIIRHSERDNAINRLYVDHPKMLYDLLEVREGLEGQAARLAAKRGTERDIYRITQAFNAMNETKVDDNNRELSAKLDFAFHRSIYEASHNAVLIHTLQNLMRLMQDSVLVSVDNLYHRDNAKSRIDDYHRLIYNSIVDHHPQRAEHAAVDHIRDVRDRFTEIEQEEQRLIRARAIVLPDD
ncbi:MAG: FCD domain-containing protein [Thiolinea sp.]